MDYPEKPDESDCCNSGCSPCIFDVYEEQLKQYDDYLQGKFKTVSQGISKNIISLTKYTQFTVIHIEKRGVDNFKFTFEYYPENNDCFDYTLTFNAGQHFMLKAPNCLEENKYFTRAYTPLKCDEFVRDVRRFDKAEEFNVGTCFQIFVKMYDHGQMSAYLRSLVVGDTTYWRGPYGAYVYIPNKSKHILMICQGTGIAPLYCVAKDIINNNDDETVVTLYCCFKDLDNAILRNELYQLNSNWNFFYNIFLSQKIPCSNCSQIEHQKCNKLNLKYKECVTEQRLSTEDIENYLLKNRDSLNILICGSAIFMEFYKDIVSRRGINTNDIIIF